MRLLFFLPICLLAFITACETSDDDSAVYDNEAGLFDTWDKNADGMLDEGEFEDNGWSV